MGQATYDKEDEMEEVTRAIEISADIATLTPYLQQRDFLRRWMHPLIESQMMADLGVFPLLREQQSEAIHHYWESVKTEFWMSERRQIFVVTFPPPALHPAYLIELQANVAGVTVVAKIHLPDTLAAEQIESQKAMMAQALRDLKGIVESQSPLSRAG